MSEGCQFPGPPELPGDVFQRGEKEYVKAVYYLRAYLTSIQSTSCEMQGWIKHKLESRFPEEILITTDMQMAPSYGRK